MTLYARLSLIVTLALLSGLLLFGALTYASFLRQQRLQLNELLLRDLGRVQSLVREGAVGSQLTSSSEDFILQFVAGSGQAVIGPQDVGIFPEADRPSLINRDERVILVASVPWLLADNRAGTIRLGLDVTDDFADRRDLLRGLLVSGAVIAFGTILVTLVLVQRSLTPLARLAEGARQVNPAEPLPIGYQGPRDEVAAVAQALNRALRNIRKRQQAERASLAEIAHELAAPLTLVAGHLESLRAAHPGDSRLEAAQGAANELLYTSKDLLTLGRGELERSLDLQLMDLVSVARQIAREYPGVRLGLLEHSEIAGSPERLAQLVRNLVRNAVQAAGAEAVMLEVRANPGEVLLSVQDNGVGVPPEELPYLFERFYTQRKQGGTGVGLTVAQQIARQHGGLITVTSVMGEGTSFTLTLPSLQMEDGDEALEESAEV